MHFLFMQVYKGSLYAWCVANRETGAAPPLGFLSPVEERALAAHGKGDANDDIGIQQVQFPGGEARGVHDAAVYVKLARRPGR